MVNIYNNIQEIKLLFPIMLYALLTLVLYRGDITIK